MIRRLGLAALAITATLAATQASKQETAQIGKPFKDFTARDIVTGKPVTLSNFKGKKVVVGIFMQNNCGTTWRYEKKIGDLIRDYKKKDVEVLAIHSSFTETDAEIRGQIDSRNLPLPILDDKKTQALRRYVGAVCSPTFFIVDKDAVMRYKGSFDDRPSNDATPYVRPALDAILNGKKVAMAQTRAFG